MYEKLLKIIKISLVICCIFTTYFLFLDIHLIAKIYSFLLLMLIGFFIWKWSDLLR